MKTFIAEFGRPMAATFFLAVMVIGPLCAAGAIILSSLDVNVVRLIRTVMLLA